MTATKRNSKTKKEEVILDPDFKENIVQVDIAEKVEQSYLDYSMSVVLARALPESKDGLKPVHRRIIYAMQKLGLLNTPTPKKSARVVGDVLGKYHPHGDSAVYDAMVILSQNFKTRYPIIDGQGNWGSIDDPKSFAAMRYTECRLTPIAETLLRDLPYDTVNFNSNFDGTEIEPSVLPASIPLNIVNGTSGIAVGVSTDYPSHNLVEIIDATIDYLKRPTKANLETTLDIIKGPDLPNGGQLLHTEEEIKNIYRESKGSFKIRAIYEVVNHSNKKGDFSLVFSQFNPDTSPESILMEIGKLLNPEMYCEKNKKPTSEQLKMKAVFSNLIDTIRDDSSDGEYLITIKNKNKEISPEQLAEALYKNTKLQKNISFNMVNIVNSKPIELNIFDYIVNWVKFRLSVMKRRFEFLLKKTKARIHILEGRLLVIDNIDKVIKIIRASDDPKVDLMNKFKLSEIQAEDILNMKLGSLSRLGRLSIEEELAKLRKDQEKYELFIQDEKALRKEAIKELESDKKTYGDARRTIIKVETNTVPDIVENLVLDKTSDENIVIALSEYGWISWKAAKQLNFNESDFKFKAGDSIKKIVVGNRAQTLLLIDNKGKSYSISLNDLSGRTGAEATNKWFKSSNKMIDIILPEDIEKGKYIISSSEGYGFIAKSMDIFTKMTAGKNLINISEQSEVLTAVKVPEVIGEKQVAVILSSENKFVAYPINNIKELAKGKGVSLMGYNKGEKVLSVGITDDNGDIKIVNDKGEISTITWKQIQKIMIAERKSTAKGKEINKLKNISGFYFEESDISAKIVKRNESQDVAQGE